MTYTIIGIVGHIDHGKTTLVRALTGIDTDTLAEEKRRGITIDLGFAFLRERGHSFALIDTPGHQKYIGNLLAGASAIDIALLVVACDQGIQRQTLEHAAVVKALGAKAVIVAISRIDLVDMAHVDELAEELNVFLADYEFQSLAIVPVSSVSGAGIDELKQVLCDYATRTSAPQREHLASHRFRMPIDRVFSVHGRGLIAAGTVWSGQVQVGDVLHIARTEQELRVRQVESHGESIQASQVGRRTAVNLVGAGDIDILRGDELIAPGAYTPANQLVVALEMFQDTIEVRCPTTVQMHTATHSCAARLLGVKRLAPGASEIVIVQPDEPIVATHLQACLFRQPYPVGALAGGRILVASSNRLAKSKNLIELGRRLKDASPASRLIAWTEFVGEWDVDATFCASQLGIAADELQATLRSASDYGSVFQLGSKLISHRAARRTTEFILTMMTQRAHDPQQAWLVDKALIERARCTGSAALVAWAVEKLIAESHLVRMNNMVAAANEHTAFSKKHKAIFERVLTICQETRSPPTIKELAEQLQESLRQVAALVRFGAQQGALIEVGSGIVMATGVFNTLCVELASLFASQPELSVADIRDLWQVTRKHAVPLLEYCDRVQLTVRRGDVRLAGPKLVPGLASTSCSGEQH